MRLAVVVSHPIQHFCPQYNSWAGSDVCDLKVIFGSDLGLTAFDDPGFGKQIKWEGLKLNFDHAFLERIGEKSNDSKASLAAELASFQPDAVLQYGYMEQISKKSLRWAKSKNVKALGFSDAENHSYRPLWKRLLKYIPVKRYLSKLDLILTTGDANESYYRIYGANDLQFLRCPYPIDRDALNQAWHNKEKHRKKIRDKYKIPEDAIVISCVGKLLSKKRQTDVVASIAKLEKEIPHITAFLIGSGPDRSLLEIQTESLTTGKVIFTDFIQPEAMFEILCATDIYVHASSLEPHSVAVSEAVFLGCPVVISDKCGSYGPTDDVQNGMNGFVYPCGNVVSMVEKISKIARSRELQNRFSLHSRQHGIRAQQLSHSDALMGIADSLDFQKREAIDKS